MQFGAKQIKIHRSDGLRKGDEARGSSGDETVSEFAVGLDGEEVRRLSVDNEVLDARSMLEDREFEQLDAVRNNLIDFHLSTILSQHRRTMEAEGHDVDFEFVAEILQVPSDRALTSTQVEALVDAIRYYEEGKRRFLTNEVDPELSEIMRRFEKYYVSRHIANRWRIPGPVGAGTTVTVNLEGKWPSGRTLDDIVLNPYREGLWSDVVTSLKRFGGFGAEDKEVELYAKWGEKKKIDQTQKLSEVGFKEKRRKSVTVTVKYP